MDYDRWLDRKWDEYCESYDRACRPRDGVYEALIELGPASAIMRYTVRHGVPSDVAGIYAVGWCARTESEETVEITGSVEMPDHALLALANPACDALLERIDFDALSYDGPVDA